MTSLQCRKGLDTDQSLITFFVKNRQSADIIDCIKSIYLETGSLVSEVFKIISQVPVFATVIY